MCSLGMPQDRWRQFVGIHILGAVVGRQRGKYPKFRMGPIHHFLRQE